jgi:hypothetical protein
MMRFTVVLLTLVLAACASYRGAGLRPGEARLEDVVQRMGQPAMRWQDPDGSIQLAYPRGPAGIHTFMVKLGPDGRLQSIVNVLDKAGLARIHPGMTQAQVLRVLGPPDYGRTAYFKARDELVWDWRACTYNVNIQRIYVLFDATAGTVRSTMSQDELFGREGITLSCAGHTPDVHEAGR